jgi:hypothetical protein
MWVNPLIHKALRGLSKQDSDIFMHTPHTKEVQKKSPAPREVHGLQTRKPIERIVTGNGCEWKSWPYLGRYC